MMQSISEALANKLAKFLEGKPEQQKYMMLWGMLGNNNVANNQSLTANQASEMFDMAAKKLSEKGEELVEYNKFGMYADEAPVVDFMQVTNTNYWVVFLTCQSIKEYLSTGKERDVDVTKSIMCRFSNAAEEYYELNDSGAKEKSYEMASAKFFGAMSGLYRSRKIARWMEKEYLENESIDVVLDFQRSFSRFFFWVEERYFIRNEEAEYDEYLRQKENDEFYAQQQEDETAAVNEKQEEIIFSPKKKITWEEVERNFELYKEYFQTLDEQKRAQNTHERIKRKLVERGVDTDRLEVNDFSVRAIIKAIEYNKKK